MRAIAVISVIIYHLHSQWLPGGFTGVDIFFVISGFVVTASLASHDTESIFSFIARFYHRRLTRILPALLVVLLATALVYSILIPRSWLSGLTGRVAFLAFFGLSNIALQDQSDVYFAPRAEFNPFTQTWSLGVEEQFYVLAPCLIYLHVTRSRRARTSPWEIVLLGLASMVIMALWTKSAPLQAFYSIASRFCELAVGCLWYLYFWSGRAQSGVAPSRMFDQFGTATGILGVAVIATTFLCTKMESFPFPWALVAVAGAVLLIGFPRGDSRICSVLASKIPVAIGLRSYSLYLWHWPILVLLRWTMGLETFFGISAAIALTVLLAEMSYRWIESPPRRNAYWIKMPPMLAVVLAISLTTACAFAANFMLSNLNIMGMSTVTRQRTDWYADHSDPVLAEQGFACQSQLGYRNLPGVTVPDMVVIEYHRNHCADGTPPTNPGAHNIFVLGDSHAVAYVPLLHRLSVDTGMSVYVYQIPGCPYIDFHWPMGTGHPKECIAHARQAIADIQSLAKPGDIAFLSSLRLFRFVDQWGFMDEAEVLRAQFSADAATLREQAIADANTWLQPLTDLKLSIIFEAPTPIFKSPPFRCADPWTAANPICAKGGTEPRAYEEWLRAPVVSAMQHLASTIPQVSIYDPLPELCSAETCSVRSVSGRPLFFDADHLSRYGNEVLYPSFRAHLIAIGALKPG
jgi:peptidoglycan/LPS O-acetylase OafA/YrhL